MRKLLLAVAGAICAIAATNARADGAVIQIFRWEEASVGYVEADCGDFQILSDSHLHWMVKLADSVLVANHIRGDVRYYNSTDPTIALDGSWVQNNTEIDVATGDFKATLVAKIMVPGVGPISKETGLFVANMDGTLYRSTGWNDYVNGNWALVCEYLAAK